METTQLTQRESEVFDLAIGGLSNDEIAARLGISRRTVEAHMRTLFRKAGVARRAQLVGLYQGGDASAGRSVPGSPDTAGGLTPRLPQHRLDLAHCERQLRCYADALHGLVDRQFPLFEERVEITLVVGERDEQDLVIERRWTRPRPYLIYRILGPIVSELNVQPDELALDCNVEGQDTHLDVHLVWDVDGRPLVMILFQPGLRAETEWVLRYHSPKLWTPLRASGVDTLTWATATLDQRHPPKINKLTLKVVFPGSWTQERLTEQSSLGTILADRLPTGQTRLTWHHEAPSAGAYHWLLHGSPPS